MLKSTPRWTDLGNVYAYRDENLRAAGFWSYRSYLRSALWREIRARVLARSADCWCGVPATQVHHRAYDPATLAGRVLDALTAVCARCHRRAERPSRLVHDRSQRLAVANTTLLRGRTKAVRLHGRNPWTPKRANPPRIVVAALPPPRLVRPEVS